MDQVEERLVSSQGTLASRAGPGQPGVGHGGGRSTERTAAVHLARAGVSARYGLSTVRRRGAGFRRAYSPASRRVPGRSRKSWNRRAEALQQQPSRVYLATEPRRCAFPCLRLGPPAAGPDAYTDLFNQLSRWTRPVCFEFTASTSRTSTPRACSCGDDAVGCPAGEGLVQSVLPASRACRWTIRYSDGQPRNTDLA